MVGREGKEVKEEGGIFWPRMEHGLNTEVGNQEIRKEEERSGVISRVAGSATVLQMLSAGLFSPDLAPEPPTASFLQPAALASSI